MCTPSKTVSLFSIATTFDKLHTIKKQPVFVVHKLVCHILFSRLVVISARNLACTEVMLAGQQMVT